MRIATSEIRTIELNALMIAFFCHLLFASVIVLKITVPKNPLKPSFVFLGSILMENDFTNLVNPLASTGSAQTLSTVKTRAYPNPFGAAQEVSKPMFSGEKPPTEKTFTKSMFITPSAEGHPSTSSDLDLGIDLTPTKRIPLKLDLK